MLLLVRQLQLPRIRVGLLLLATLFFSQSECAYFSQGALDVALDWRLVVRPPLLLHNSLPVPARYVVWERSGGAGSSLRARQQGTVGAWGTAPVYAIDVRQQVRGAPLSISWAVAAVETGKPNI